MPGNRIRPLPLDSPDRIEKIAHPTKYLTLFTEKNLYRQYSAILENIITKESLVACELIPIKRGFKATREKQTNFTLLESRILFKNSQTI